MKNGTSPFLKPFLGAGAGLNATHPMTIFMRSAWMRLPRREKVPLPPQITQNVFKLAQRLRSGSDLGWIPALGILPSATGHPWRRNLIMIVAHLIWGGALGVLTRAMRSEKYYIDLE